MFKKTYQGKTKGILQDITSWFVSNEMILSDGMPELENLTSLLKLIFPISCKLLTGKHKVTQITIHFAFRNETATVNTLASVWINVF